MIKYILSLLIICNLQFACKSTYSFTGEVQHLQQEEAGTISLRSKGYGNTKQEALAHAEKSAFETLIFQGIPGSSFSKAMISNKAEALKTHAAFFKNLLEEKTYKTFLMASEPSSKYGMAVKGQKNMDVNLKINVRALRKHLETKQIIRKLGL